MGYAGPVAFVSPDGTNFTSTRLCRPTHTFNGGSFTVLNGTGAGQLRRLVAWGIVTNGQACWFKINAPFTVAVVPGSGQWVSAQIFKGANLYEGNVYEDVGSFQLYGMAMDVIVHAERGHRMTGFHNWGQWHRRNDTGDHVWHNQPHPNMRTQWIANTLADGQGAPHAAMPMIPANAFKEGVQFSNSAFSVVGAQRGRDGRIFPIPMNRLSVWRGNHITGTNVGFDLGRSYWSSEAVVEGNVMEGLMRRNQTIDPRTGW